MASQDAVFPCAECGNALTLATDVDEFRCDRCGHRFSFRECDHCRSVEQVGPSAARSGPWRCRICWQTNRVTRKTPALPARARHAELAERGLLASAEDVRMLGGFTHVGGTGFPITPGSVCSMTGAGDALVIRAEIGVPESIVRIPYAELTGLELGGGTSTSGGGFIGGGFGLEGAAQGMIAASVLNTLTSTTSTNTGVHVGSTSGEIFLHHGSLTPDVIRNKLSPAFARYEAARHRGPLVQPPAAADPVAQLEGLARLRDSGVLTPEEFEAARAPIVRRLTGEAP